MAGEPLVREVAPDFEWNFPLRLLAALHYLALDGRAPELARAYAGEGEVWPAFREALAVWRRAIREVYLRVFRE